MPRSFFVLIICCCCLTVKGQALLLNGGFEEENTCTEYNVECAPEAWLTNDERFSNYFKDIQRSHNSLHCMAIEAGNATKPFKRTFIRSQLVCGLRKGNQYAIQFFIRSPHAILDSIGIYFSSADVMYETRSWRNVQPSVYLGEQNTFSKDNNWQQVNIKYTATGTEAFFAIANFSKRDITGPTHIDKENSFFLFIDDISMVPVNANEKICDDWQLQKQNIYDQDERHEFLRRKIKTGKANPPENIVLTPGKVIRIDTLLMPDVLFASGKAQLQNSSIALLDSFCKTMPGKQIDSLVIEGHTDNTGSAELNQQLSIERAKTVAAHFIAQKIIKPGLVFSKGFGASQPITTNNTAEGKQQNRRVSIFLYIRE